MPSEDSTGTSTFPSYPIDTIELVDIMQTNWSAELEDMCEVDELMIIDGEPLPHAQGVTFTVKLERQKMFTEMIKGIRKMADRIEEISPKEIYHPKTFFGIPEVNGEGHGWWLNCRFPMMVYYYPKDGEHYCILHCAVA